MYLVSILKWPEFRAYLFIYIAHEIVILASVCMLSMSVIGLLDVFDIDHAKCIKGMLG